MAVALAVLLTLTGASPALELRQEGGCVDEPSLRQALGDQIPDDTDASALRLQVQAWPLATDAQWRVALRLEDREARPLLERELVVAQADCPGVEALLAAMVARRLAELPRTAFVIRQPLAVRELDPAPPRAADTTLRLGAGAGVGLGIERPDGQGLLELRLDAGLPGWPLGAVVGLGGSYGSYPVGPGQVQILAPRLSLGIGKDLDVAGLILSPRLLLDLGVHVAAGSGFAQDLVAVLPLLSGRAELAVYTRRGVYAALGLELPVVRAVFAEQGSRNLHREPWLRPRGVVGFAWDLLP